MDLEQAIGQAINPTAHIVGPLTPSQLVRQPAGETLWWLGPGYRHWWGDRFVGRSRQTHFLLLRRPLETPQTLGSCPGSRHLILPQHDAIDLTLRNSPDHLHHFACLSKLLSVWFDSFGKVVTLEQVIVWGPISHWPDPHDSPGRLTRLCSLSGSRLSGPNHFSQVWDPEEAIALSQDYRVAFVAISHKNWHQS